MYLTLKLVNGEILQESVESNVCIIGRSAKCTVVVPHDGMSRQHCQIDVVDGEYFITDLGSTNGVYIDGQRIEANQKTPYQTFLTLSFGAVQSLIIENEEAAGGSINAGASSAARREMARDGATGVTSFTKTRAMQDPNKTPTGSAQAKIRPKTAADKNDKTSMLVTYVVIGLMVAGVAWWYSQKEDAVDADIPVIEETNEPPKEQVKPYESF